MRLLPTWEKSPFNHKRALEQSPNVNAGNDAVRSREECKLPSNSSLWDNKRPVDAIPMTETDTCQNATYGSALQPSSYAYNAESVGLLSGPAKSPHLDLTFTASSSLLQMFDNLDTMVDTQGSGIQHGKVQDIGPPRQTSNSSSTSRSRGSISSSHRSRPSSRSSFDDQGTSSAPGKTSGYRGLGHGSPVWYQRHIPSQEIVIIKPSRNLPHPVSPRAIAISRERSLSTASTGHLAHPNEGINNTSTLGSTTSSVSDSPRSKRGARLGSLMVESLDDRSPPPIRSTFGLGDLPAIKPRNSRIEKIEMTRRAQAVQQQTNAREPSPEVTSEAAERVLLGILRNLNTIRDLVSTAMVDKGFYRVLRLHEQDLVNRVLYSASPPAWELRYILHGEQKRGAFKLKPLQRDVATIRTLHTFMLMKCQHVCRSTTIDALLEVDSVRKAELDNALWRIWSFCKLFGTNKGRYDIKTQIMWLEGGHRHMKGSKADMFGIGNGRGLSVQELEDMSEMWRCLETLLAGFKGHEADARKAGVFDNCIIDDHDSATEQYFLDIWIHELLCLGPKAVLTLNSCSFEQARVLGVTKWTPSAQAQGRGEFCKGAIEEVYRERLVSEARTKAIQFEKEMRTRSKPSRVTSHSLVTSPLSQTTSKQLRIITDPARTTCAGSQNAGLIIESPMLSSNYTSLSPVSPLLPQNSSTMRPAAFSSLSLATTASARFGATLFPVPHQTYDQPHRQTSPDQIPLREEVTLRKPQVLDPVDKAMRYLVNELGFTEYKAKQALAMSDNGTGIDIQRAIDLLMIGTEARVEKQTSVVAELSGAPITLSSVIHQSSDYSAGSQISAPSHVGIGDMSTAQPGITHCRKSFLVSTNRNADEDHNVEHESSPTNSRQTTCSPVQSTTTMSIKSRYPTTGSVRQDDETGHVTSPYTIAGSQHSHKPSLSLESTKFDPYELGASLSIYSARSPSTQVGLGIENTATLAELQDRSTTQPQYQHQLPIRATTFTTTTTTSTTTTSERKPRRVWSFKEAFWRRDEPVDETIGCAL